MTCMVNSVLVVLVGATISWLVGALTFVATNFAVPILPCCVLFLITIRGFRNRPNIRSHCAWIIMFGCLAGTLLNPYVQTTGRLTVTAQLFGFYYEFGAVNASLICASILLTLFACWECLSDDQRNDKANIVG